MATWYEAARSAARALSSPSGSSRSLYSSEVFTPAKEKSRLSANGLRPAPRPRRARSCSEPGNEKASASPPAASRSSAAPPG